MWDLKPKAPQRIRGIYKPTDTTLPGFQVCEHLPQLAKVAHHLTVVRSVSHRIVDHNASSYYMLTGQSPFRDSRLIRGPHRENAPPYGSVLAKLRPINQPLPDYVHLPRRMFNCGNFIPGVLAGFLGDAYDPFIAGDPSSPGYKVPGLEQRLSDSHFNQRRRLLDPPVERREGDSFADTKLIYAQTARLAILQPLLLIKIILKTGRGSTRFSHHLPSIGTGNKTPSLPMPASMDSAHA